MQGSNHGYTPVLASIGLSREAVLRATGQDPSKPMECQDAYEQDRAGRYATLLGNRHVVDGGKLREVDIAIAYLLRESGMSFGKVAKLYGVTREAFNKQFRLRGLQPSAGPKQRIVLHPASKYEDWLIEWDGDAR